MYALSAAIIMLMITLFDHMLCGVPLTVSVDSHRGQMTEVLSQIAVSGFCGQDLGWSVYSLQRSRSKRQCVRTFAASLRSQGFANCTFRYDGDDLCGDCIWNVESPSRVAFYFF
jgi:hypothetical protein